MQNYKQFAGIIPPVPWGEQILIVGESDKYVRRFDLATFTLQQSYSLPNLPAWSNYTRGRIFVDPARYRWFVLSFPNYTVVVDMIFGTELFSTSTYGNRIDIKEDGSLIALFTNSSAVLLDTATWELGQPLTLTTGDDRGGNFDFASNQIYSTAWLSATSKTRIDRISFNTDKGFYLTGSSGDYLSAPDSIVNSITGDIDIRVKVAMDDWTPAVYSVLVAKNTSGQAAYRFGINTDGTINLNLSANGTAKINANSTAATGFVGGASHWVRVTWSDSGDVANYYTSVNGETWTQLGNADVPLVMAGIFDSSAGIELGSQLGGVSNNLAGTIYEAQIYNGIDGTLAIDLTPSDYVSGSTFNSNQMAGDLTGTGGDSFSMPSYSTINLALGIAFDLRIVCQLKSYRDSSYQSLMSKWETTGSKKTFRFMLSPLGALYLGLSTTGSNSFSDLSTEVVPDEDGAILGMRAVLATDGTLSFYTSSDLGVTWVQLGVDRSAVAPVNLHQDSAVLEIGQNDGSGYSIDGSILSSQIYNGDTLALDFTPQNYVSGSTLNSDLMSIYFAGGSGDYVKTPDSVAASITGDIQIIVRANSTAWNNTSSQVLVSKYENSSNERSYVFFTRSRELRFTISQDGSAGIGFTSTIPLSSSILLNDEYAWVKAELDVDDGNSNSQCTFYYSLDSTRIPSEVTWIQLGDSVAGGSVLSIFDGTAPVGIGASQTNDGNSGRFTGLIDRAQIYNVIKGVSPVLDYNVEDYVSGSTFNSNLMAADLPVSGLASVRTPSAVANQIVGDIDIQAKLTISDWTPSGRGTIVSKRTSGQEAFQLRINTDGKIAFITWSSSAALSVVSTVATGIPDGETKWVRVTLDVNDGAGNNVHTFYLSDDGETWSQLGDAVVTAGTTSIDATTAIIEVGAYASSSDSLNDASFYKVKIYNGIQEDGGTLAVYLNPQDYVSGSTLTSSTTGEVWTAYSNAAFTGQFSLEGSTAVKGVWTANGSASFTGQWTLEGNTELTQNVLTEDTSSFFYPHEITSSRCVSGRWYGTWFYAYALIPSAIVPTTIGVKRDGSGQIQSTQNIATLDIDPKSTTANIALAWYDSSANGPSDTLGQLFTVDYLGRVIDDGFAEDPTGYPAEKVTSACYSVDRTRAFYAGNNGGTESNLQEFDPATLLYVGEVISDIGDGGEANMVAMVCFNSST